MDSEGTKRTERLFDSTAAKNNRKPRRNRTEDLIDTEARSAGTAWRPRTTS
jgi:hypothetical protein